MPAPLATREQKLQAVELAAVHGPTAAANALNIKHETLKHWCYQDFRQEYSEFRAGKLSEWRAQFAAEMEDLQHDYARTERLALEQAERLLGDPELDAKDVASLIKGMGAARASATGTAGRARGEPDQETRLTISFPELEQLAHAVKQHNAIEGTAEEARDELNP